MGCNMRCGHCGSSCAEPLKDELTSEEALELCGQLADLGLKWVTLSGGEPTTRKDLPQLVKRLTELGVSVNIITNGWLLNPELVKKFKNSGVTTVAISIDGTGEIHDRVRRPGAFAHAEQAFAALKAAGITAGAVTTLFAMGERERAIDRMKQAAAISGPRQEEMKNNLRRMGYTMAQ